MPFKRSSLYALLATYLILGSVYSVVTPLMEASDELWHYPMVKYVADHWALPVQEPGVETAWRQEGSQPPLYYLLAAALTSWIDTSDLDRVRRLNPHADNGKITEDGNTNLIVHPPATQGALFRGDWHGTGLAIHLIRLMSVLMGAGTVYLGYRLVLDIWPRRWGLALVAAALTAFNPMFLFISGAVNNDNLAMLLCALGLWQLVRLVKEHGGSGTLPVHRWRQDVLWLGIVLGLAVLTKTSTMGLLPLAALAISFVAWKRRSWRLFMSGGAITAGLVALIAGWWFLRNAILYDGDWFGLERFIQVLGYRVPPATLRQLWSERVGFMMAYWGLFGGVNVALPAWTYRVLNTALVLSGIGCLVGLARLAWRTRDALRSAGPGSASGVRISVQHVQWALLALWPVVVLVSWAGWATRTWSSQGRLIFSAITAWSAWMALGLSLLMRRRGGNGTAPIEHVPGALLALSMLGLAVWAPLGVIAPAYRAPVLSPGEAVAPSHTLQADVGGQVRLLGYDLDQPSADGRLHLVPGEAVRLSLYWEAQTHMERDWSIFFHVLDSDLDLVLATRDRYPGQGLLATSDMVPQQRWVDRYVVWLRATTFAPSRGVLELGLYDLVTGERPPIQVIEGAGVEVVDHALRFQPLQIDARRAEVPNPLRYRMEDKMALVGWDVAPRVVAAGETLQLTLYWECLAEMSTDYQVSTQVVRAGQLKAAQLDTAPGGIPTGTWKKGDRITDRRELSVDSAAFPGGYDLLVSVYGWEAGDSIQRLRLIDGNGFVLPGDSLTLGQVRVVP